MNCKVLLMTANPEKQNLRLDAEQRALMDAVHRSERQRQLRDAGSVSGAIEFVRVGATRLRDVPRMVQLHRPHALHFSGHGANGGELIFEDEAGQRVPVTAQVLAALHKRSFMYADSVHHRLLSLG